MHCRGGQPPDLGEQVVLGVMGKVMSLAHRQVVCDGDVDLGAQGVPNPADPQLSHVLHAVHAEHG
jgi:hypothetical protein